MSTAKLSFVLVDYENIQALDLSRVNGLPIKIVLFMGRHQKSVPTELLKRVCELKGTVEVVESVAAGKNAVDFQIACYAGRIAERDPTAAIYFLSKDKGFNVLVEYLKAQQRTVSRVESMGELPLRSGREHSNPGEPAQRAEFALERLIRCPAASRPRKLRTLRSSVHAMFGKRLHAAEVAEVVERMIADGKVLVGEKESVSYNL